MCRKEQRFQALLKEVHANQLASLMSSFQDSRVWAARESGEKYRSAFQMNSVQSLRLRISFGTSWPYDGYDLQWG